MATAIPLDPDDLFENTNVNKIMTFSPPTEKPFGILDLQPNSITEPPEFTEQETLEAMRNLHVLPSDLVPTNIETISGFDDNPSMKIQVTLELERRRFKTIENIIQERNRLVNIVPEAVQIPKDLPPEILSKLQPSKKKKPKKKIPARHSLKGSDEGTEESISKPSGIPKPKKKKRIKKSFKKSDSNTPTNGESEIKSPLRTDLIQKSKISRPKLSNRRHYISDFQALTMVHKEQDLNAFRKHRQEEQQEKAQKVHERVAAAEKMQQDMKEKHQEMIRKRAQLRLQRLKGEETALEKKKKELQAEAEIKLQREERQYMKMQEKKQKAFDREKKMREKKIYGTTHKAPSQFAALRKQLILSKLSNQNQTDSESPNSNSPNVNVNKSNKQIEKLNDAVEKKEKKEKKQRINSLAPKSLQTQIPKPTKSSSVSKSANEKSGSNSSHPIIQLPEVGKYKSKIPYLHVH